MPRLSRIEDVLFPVEEHPVFVNVRMKPEDRRLRVPYKKAIVNVQTYRVLGVVSREYRLVTNREALDWAYQCCCIAFPETKSSEWEVKASDAPGSGGHCFIDLMHNSTALDFSMVQANNRPDVFGPFIRVTNSYNGLRALSFDIGFFRKICKNGLILPASIISFKFTHLQRDIRNEIKFEIAHEKLFKFKTSFNEYIGGLKQCAVPRKDFEPLIYGVLFIRKPKDINKNDIIAEDWEALSDHLGSLCSRYSEELGENAYAVFNAITDFASHPLENRCVHRERHSFQRLAGNWLSQFSQECHQTGFKISEYLVKLADANGKKN